MNEKIYTRRDFIRGTLGAAAGAAVLGNVKLNSESRLNAAAPSRVVLVRNEGALNAANQVDAAVLRHMLDETVTKFTGKANAVDAWKSLVTAGDTVGLVATPHLNPTHTELIDAVRQSLIAAGIPEKSIVDGQGGPDKPRACTALIALPALKAHWLTGIGTVLKNYITYSGNPSGYHDENNVKLGEIWNLPFVKGKTKLVIVDALVPLCDKGPQPDPRYKWPYKGLIAGADPVAVETVCLKVIMEKRRLIHGGPWPLSPPPVCVEAADKTYKLGTSSLESIRIEKSGWMQDALV
jgi:hypothetical protein